MKCKKLLLFWLFYLSFAPLSVYAQGAEANSQLLQILELLNNCDMNINNYEMNMTNSNQIIQDLSKKVIIMQNTIEMQQRQLKQDSQNLMKLEADSLQKYRRYEQTLQLLETSYRQLLTENGKKDDKILKLTEKNATQMKLIFILSGILCLFVILFIAVIIIKLKTGGILKAIK